MIRHRKTLFLEDIKTSTSIIFLFLLLSPDPISRPLPSTLPRCSISNCDSAFTTKQCLQQHYGRAHQLRGSAVPPITRSVPYTVRGYSGLLAESTPSTRRRLLCRGDRLRFSDFSVSRDLPEPSSGPRLMQEASRSELDSIEPSLILGSRGAGNGGVGDG